MKLLALFAGIVAVVTSLLLWAVNQSTEQPTYATELLLTLAITTLLIFYYLLQWVHKRPQLFAQFYLLTIALKLLGYGALVAFVVIDDPAGAIANVVLFLLAYVVFTFLEVLFLFRQVTRQ
jgi:hypothetical protein